jgi:hypothetical protein
MAYIGRDPQYGAFDKQPITADGSTTTFTLDYTVGSAASNVNVVVEPSAVIGCLSNAPYCGSLPIYAIILYSLILIFVP